MTNINYRSSAADALLWAEDQQRESLTVLAKHKVNKVLFDEMLSTVGVEFGTNVSGSWHAFANKEVILSAGSLASAPILERSGVGSARVLKTAGVKQFVELPGVGANLCVSSPRARRISLADNTVSGSARNRTICSHFKLIRK